MTVKRRQETTPLTALSESLGDYLEVILCLVRENKVARARDIAKMLGVQRGSVTGALKALQSKGLINYEPYSFVTLTEEGAEFAEEIARRHKILRNFFFGVLRVEYDIADRTACRIEHVIDPAILERLLCFLEFLRSCPRAGEDWIRAFEDFCVNGPPDRQTCSTCIEKCSADLRADCETADAGTT